MATHHCGTYSSSPYCNCYNQTGEDKQHYKQFDIESQTYNCCDQITASLIQLSDIPEVGETILPNTPLVFFNRLSTKSYNGCCYKPYFTNSDTGEEDDVQYFQTNYTDLYYNYLTVETLYNNFVAGKVTPTMLGNNVTCGGTCYPFILSHKSPNETYHNYTFICSENTNDVFPSLAVAYGNVDYRITRFYDNATGLPCTGTNCQLITNDASYNNFGDVVNQGNLNPAYHNNPKAPKGGFIASGVLAVLLFLVSIYVFYKIHKKMKLLEDQRIK